MSLPKAIIIMKYKLHEQLRRDMKCCGTLALSDWPLYVFTLSDWAAYVLTLHILYENLWETLRIKVASLNRATAST